MVITLRRKGQDVEIDLVATCVYWIQLAQNGVLLWALVNKVNKCWVLHKTTNFLKQLNNYHLLKILWS